MKIHIITKNISKITLLFLAVLLISATSLTGQNKIVMATANMNDDIAYTTLDENISLEFYAGNNEAPTEIEAWMSSTNFWKKIKSRLEVDNTLKIESWMSNPYFWNDLESISPIENWMMDTNFWCDLEGNYEEPIQIEKWMTDTELWTNNETSLKIETWMSDENFWSQEETLAIEDWMTDTEYWVSFDKEETIRLESWMTNINYWAN